MTPILVSAAGRSGTTLMMRTLDGSNAITVARAPPFEVRHLAYYWYAHRVLTAPADLTRSTHPDRLRSGGFAIGFNPYTHGNFARIFRDPAGLQQFRETSDQAILAAFRECVVGYYRPLAEQYGKTPSMFAEKNDNMSAVTRAFTQRAFDAVHHIFLVRDPRDLYCSHRSYFKNSPEKSATDVANATKGMLWAWQHRDKTLTVIRYEDMVRDRQKIVSHLNAFLGVTIDEQDVGAGFRSHGTSASPEESIGRWRADMTPEEQAVLIPRVQETIETFGYEA